MQQTISKKSQSIIDRFGLDNCLWAFEEHRNGNGASTIGFALKVHFKQACSMIDAGEEYCKFQNRPAQGYNPEFMGALPARAGQDY